MQGRGLRTREGEAGDMKRITVRHVRALAEFDSYILQNTDNAKFKKKKKNLRITSQ